MNALCYGFTTQSLRPWCGARTDDYGVAGARHPTFDPPGDRRDNGCRTT